MKRKNISRLMVLAPALVMSLSVAEAQTGKAGAFEYGIKATTNVSKDQTKVQDLEFVGGLLITEGIKGIIRMELEDQDLSDVQIEDTLEEMKLSIAIDQVTGNPRALITNLDIGIIEAVFKSSMSENSNYRNNFLYELSDSDRGVVGLTMELNPELLKLVDSARISIYEAGSMDGFDISNEKAVAAEISKRVGQFVIQFSSRWKETASKADDWTNQLAVVWDKGEGFRVWGSVLQKNNNGIYNEKMAATLGAAYDLTWGTLFAEAEFVPHYASALTLGVNVKVADGVTVGPYVRQVLGDSISDDTQVGVNVTVALYKSATRAFLEKRK
jgi:hypothetical protein